MVGRLRLPFGRAHFQGRTVSFREGIQIDTSKIYTSNPWHHFFKDPFDMQKVVDNFSPTLKSKLEKYCVQCHLLSGNNDFQPVAGALSKGSGYDQRLNLELGSVEADTKHMCFLHLLQSLQEKSVVYVFRTQDVFLNF